MAQRKDYKIRISEQGAKRVRSEMDKIDQTGQRLRSTLIGIGTSIAGAFTVDRLIRFGKSAIDTAGQFEFLRVRLENLFGSVEAGNRAFETFNKLAAQTPFELRNVVEAGASLKAFGLNAEQTLSIAADLAAFMGEDIVFAASAMGRAFAGGAGAADLFRDRGIRTLIESKQHIDANKVSLEEWQQAMFRTFLDPTAGIIGATEKLSKTIVGMESNASDAFTRLQATVGEKFAPAYRSALEDSISITEDLNTVISEIDFDEEGNQFNQFLSLLAKADPLFGLIKAGVDVFDDLTDVLHDTAEEIREGQKNFELFQSMMDSFGGRVEETGEKAETLLIPAIQNLNVEMRNLSELEMPDIEFIDAEGASANLGKIATDPGWDLLKSKANQFSGLLSDAIVTQWERGESAMENFVESFKSALAAMAAELAARAAIFGVFNLFGFGTAIQATLGSFLGFGGGRQHGGPVSPGQVYETHGLGQREFFVPTQAGRIETVTNNSPVINLYVSDIESFEQFLRTRGGAEAVARTLPEVI